MKELLEHPGPIITAVLILLNFFWSVLNLRLMRSMEKKFVTRELFHAQREVDRVRLGALVERVRKLEGAGA